MPIAIQGKEDEGVAVPAVPSPFPARSKQAEAVVKGSRVQVMCMSFADKILLTIAQDGRLAHWVHVPLEPADPNMSHPRAADSHEDRLLPMSHLTATTLLGGSSSERDTLAQLYATQIASAILLRHPEENRLLVVGSGFKQTDVDRDAFLEVLNLVLDCI